MKPVFVEPPRCMLIVGDYGSGKTEVAVNLVLHLAAQAPERRLALADLDLVNPYFRSREAVDVLEQVGVRVVIPRDGQQFADLPILMPEVKGLLQDRETMAVLDVGGDEVGSRVLAGLAPYTPAEETAFWFVLNAKRPFNDTPAGCLDTIQSIERAAGLPVTGLVANTHLMDETTPSMVLEGVQLAEAVGRARGLPITLVTAMEPVIAALPPDAILYPVLALRRIMVPPWRRRDLPSLGPPLLRHRAS